MLFAEGAFDPLLVAPDSEQEYGYQLKAPEKRPGARNYSNYVSRASDCDTSSKNKVGGTAQERGMTGGCEGGCSKLEPLAVIAAKCGSEASLPTRRVSPTPSPIDAQEGPPSPLFLFRPRPATMRC